ncbi:hypothetical protein [Neisseria meningitidis]|uniref:hypothetical protein n=1 Tax=Neisseria meningitidis TaxID=487 RepID=UPI001BADFB04|nr:hypothetical protein [Neisseria meningitidis]
MDETQSGSVKGGGEPPSRGQNPDYDTVAAATGTDAAKKIDTKHLQSPCRDAASVVCIETPPTAFYKNT